MEALDLRYPGGKGLAGLAEWIVAHFPPHVWYAEPFAGKGGVYRHKPPALRSYLVDDDPDVVAWWGRIATPGTIVTCGDGIRWVELAAEWAPPELLIYLDPPYLLSTRSKRRLYRNELSDQQHVRLLTAAKACRCPVLISGYQSPLYAEQLTGWSCDSREVITRGGVLRTEHLWSNSPSASSPPVAMKYSALGSNFRERERVNRKLQRWQRKLSELPRHEQRALLLSLIGCQPRRP